MKLGRRQTELLRQLANPFLFLIVGDRVADSLVKRGLLAETGPTGGFYQITPAGLRHVADLWEAGAVRFEREKPGSLEVDSEGKAK